MFPAGCWLFAAGSLTFAASPAPPPIALGVLQPSPARAPQLAAAGVTLVVVNVSWAGFEPSPGATDPAYLARLRRDLSAYRQAGLRPILDLGFQYPPAWLLDLPDSRYQNQYGDRFIDPASGKNIPDYVFNAAVRARQTAYLAALFGALGTDFYAVRLGGGWYGELNYPPATYRKNANCYWAFGPLAQGLRPGLPAGVAPCPVPGWKPGAASPSHASARAFLDWYLDSLENYHDWQISAVRRLYPGPLLMLYPSWGIRPGQLDAALAGDLSGRSPAETTGEVPRGFDFARFIAGIRDSNVWIHCTWIDPKPAWCQDDSPDEAHWSPVHYLSALARRHVPPLPVSAENTGGGGMPALELSAQRARACGLRAFFWAFAPDLFDGRPPELADLTRAFEK